MRLLKRELLYGLQSLAASKRAVVMTPGAHTYKRFVAIETYCMTAEWGYPTTARQRQSFVHGRLCVLDRAALVW